MPKNTLKKLKIAVLAGGTSGERAVSLRSGKNVLESLRRQKFNAVQMDTDGNLIDKLKRNKIDLVFIALHGRFGEDGVIQGVLELAGIPYTGSGVLASALAMNKVAAKKIFMASAIPTPNFVEINPDADPQKEAERIKKIFPFPMVLKPVSEGSSLGVSIINKEDNLAGLISAAVEEYKDVFIEEFVKGKEVTVGIIGEEALPILELVPKGEFYDFESKYTDGGCKFILPATLNKALTKKTQAVALRAHKALGCKGVSRVDIIVTRDHIPFVHEINTIPGMTDLSDLPAEAKEAGISFDQLVVRILESAISKKE